MVFLGGFSTHLMTFCDHKFISKPIFLLQPKWFEKEKREGATAEYSNFHFGPPHLHVSGGFEVRGIKQ